MLTLIVRIGVPMGIQMITTSLAELALLSLVNSFGSAATATYGSVTQIMNYVQFPALSIGVATSILGAQAIGAGRGIKLREITNTGLGVNMAVTGVLDR